MVGVRFMNTLGYFKNYLRLSLSALFILGLLSACAQQIDKAPNATAEQPANVETTGTSNIRLCGATVELIDESALEVFYDKIVKNIEGKPTACLNVNNNKSTPEAKFRLEYEDDFGIRYYNTRTTDLIHLDINLQARTIDIIFFDTVGFVQIKGSYDKATSIFTGEIKFYNLPSQEEALKNAIAERVADCKLAAERAKAKLSPLQGKPTVAQCMGYNDYPVFWWDAPQYTVGLTPDHALEQALEVLDSEDAIVIGTVKFDLADVIQQ